MPARLIFLVYIASILMASTAYLPFLPPHPHTHIILASQSPRRSSILQTMGLPPASFTVVVSPFDEDDSDFRSLKTRVSSSEYVKTSASNKASAVVELYRGGERELPSPATRGVVIGADTVVELGGKVLEKPKSEEEARGMLRR